MRCVFVKAWHLWNSCIKNKNNWNGIFLRLCCMLASLAFIAFVFLVWWWFFVFEVWGCVYRSFEMGSMQHEDCCYTYSCVYVFFRFFCWLRCLALVFGNCDNVSVRSSSMIVDGPIWIWFVFRFDFSLFTCGLIFFVYWAFPFCSLFV